MCLFSSFERTSRGEVPQPRGTLKYDIYSFTDELPTYERDRFLSYAAHVRALQEWYAMIQYKWIFARESWAIVERAFRDVPVPLFPNLQELAWRVDPSAPASILLLLTSSIRKLSLSWKDYSQTDVSRSPQEWTELWIALLVFVADRVPQLHTLTLSAHNRFHPVINIRTLNPLFRLRSLHDLSLGSIPGSSPITLEFDDLVRLGDMALESFRIVGRLGAPGPSPSTPAVFHNLTLLDLLHHDSRNVSVFNHFSAPVLRDLRVGTFYYWDVEDLRRTCEAWTHSFPSLRKINVRCEVPAHEHPGPSHPVSYAVAPLLRLRTLEDFSLSWIVHSLFGVNDNDVLALVTAWPSLTSLALWTPNAYGVGNGVAVTPAALSTAAARCPGLWHLSLPRIECPFKAIAEMEQLMRTSYPLTELKFENWAIREADMPVFTAYLDRVFPHLLKRCRIDHTQKDRNELCRARRPRRRYLTARTAAVNTPD